MSEPKIIGVMLSGRPTKSLRVCAAALQRMAEDTHKELDRSDPKDREWIDHCVDLFQQLAKAVAAAGVASRKRNAGLN